MNKFKIILLATIFLLIGCGAKQKDKDKETVMEKTNLEKDRAIISTQFGDIELEFFDDIAPKHVESFKLHAKNGYYDGTIFHRVIPEFMLQGFSSLFFALFFSFSTLFHFTSSLPPCL